MAMLGCLPPLFHLNPYYKYPKHHKICSQPISFQNLTMLELTKEKLLTFANDLKVMEKVDLENAVDCSEPCLQAFYNVKISSSEIADFDGNWMSIAFLDKIQG